jgi:hypothetical protein
MLIMLISCVNYFKYTITGADQKNLPNETCLHSSELFHCHPYLVISVYMSLPHVFLCQTKSMFKWFPVYDCGRQYPFKYVRFYYYHWVNTSARGVFNCY